MPRTRLSVTGVPGAVRHGREPATPRGVEAVPPPGGYLRRRRHRHRHRHRHETYLAGPGRHEAIYVNMPAFGLARAGGYRPVATRGERAAQRLAAGDLAAGDLAAGD